MIRSFYIDNFKSLVDFRLPPAPQKMGQFTCLVGLNGAGKSTVLQAFDFVGHLVSGRISDWLSLRDWVDADIKSRFLNRTLINFELQLDAGLWGCVVWTGAYNATMRRCTTESITVGEQEILRTGEESFTVAGRNGSDTFQLPRHGLQYEGSVLSIIDPKRGMHEALQELKVAVGALRSLDMLNPHEMRRRSRDSSDIGYGGERLSGFFHRMPREDRGALRNLLKDFYPSLRDLSTRSARAGWRDLRVSESYADFQGKPLDTGARQINDGLLRVLAILTQVSTPSVSHQSASSALLTEEELARQPCVLFDEIENGINPELIERLIGVLLRAKRQVIVTTHSPMILNYLPDKVARQAVVMLYRNPAGHTRAVRLFDLPSMSKKLDLLGPGEAYVDTHLEHLPAEAESLSLGGQG